MKVIVIGLDGASFNLISPWIAEGYLPNIKKIMLNGVYGRMESCLPPVTVPNWKCYSTGKNPGKLGVYWWEMVDWTRREINIPNSHSFTEKEIWDYLSETGYKVGIINMPTTFPPHKVRGIMISGGFSAMSDGYTYPTSLKKRLDSYYKYRLHPNNFIQSKKDCMIAIGQIKDIIKKRFEVAWSLMQDEKFDFLHLTIVYINVLHHFLWNHIEVRNTWRLIDSFLGKYLDDDYNVIIMSDHGTNKINRVFSINTWLENNNFLYTKESSSDILLKLGITQENMSKLLNTFRITSIINSSKILTYIPNSLVGRIPSNEGIKNIGKENKIDWKRSVAFASGQGPIYLNKLLSSKSYRKKRSLLIQMLKNIVDEQTNSSPFKDIYNKEDVYSGNYLNSAPDLMLEQNDGWHISGNLGGTEVFYDPEKWEAENSKYGLFLAMGPDIENKGFIDDIRILDLAPTILKMFNVNVPDDMDGKVLQNILK